MKNLIAELLVKLAEKEDESKELVAQVEALEIVVTALLRRMEQSEQSALINGIEEAMAQARPTQTVAERDAELLQQYLKKLLKHPRS
ncbi:anti-adapter protein IraP [Siccibacter colletis]|uniref:Anti-adapter protein IraP n=1 Tax=Siccibacter colletis TaxID=1505757 RepID=A0ABY6JGK3_9ENTR|nr:anti-adapter protein IraP [Siccibacter colletis]UYU32747.1 anti-adapter protein IraP [Siccibacter colletis]